MPRRPPAPAALACLLAVAACGGGRAVEEAANGVTPLRVVAAADVLVLEAGGTPPPDTVVRVLGGSPRSIVLRNGPPDYATFAVVDLPENAFPAGETPEVTLRPRPGVYGLDLAATRPFTGGTITFKYARHFAAPLAARERYGSEPAFERALAIGRFRDEATIVLLPTRHTLADNVSTPLDGPGSYVVAAPK